MSAGNPIISARVSRELLEEIRATIARRNEWTKEEPWEMADFLKSAIKEKLRKMQASRSGRKQAASKPR